jgi:hypothetical protein
MVDLCYCKAHSFPTRPSQLIYIITFIIKRPASSYHLIPYSILLLLRLALSSFFLHPLATRRFASQLFDFAEPIAVGVALLAGRFHRVDAVLLVGLRRDVPGFGAGDGADGGLEGGC